MITCVAVGLLDDVRRLLEAGLPDRRSPARCPAAMLPPRRTRAGASRPSPARRWRRAAALRTATLTSRAASIALLLGVGGDGRDRVALVHHLVARRRGSCQTSAALTPGAFCAADRSIDTMRACGCGERTILAVEHAGAIDVEGVARAGPSPCPGRRAA